ncbi:unnamed protein product [Camellia sinensis]
MKLLAKRLSNKFIPLQVMFFFVIIVLALVSSSNVAAYASFGEEGTEAVALLKWKASLDNQSQSLLSSWVGSNNPCNNWVGIGCNNVGRVTSMNFTGCGLRGTLHNFNFSSFPSLLRMDFGNNSLSGTIPPHFSNLSKLIFLDLSLNHLSGTIPFEMCLLSNLNFFDMHLNDLSLHSNYLTGSIPASIGNLSSLSTRLYLNSNKLSGHIPSNIGNLRKLQVLFLFQNQLTGTIPPELNNLTFLVGFAVSQNELTGHLPRDICSGGLLRLLTANDNHIQGLIPKSLTKNCTNLYRVRLQRNELTGNLSEDFVTFPALNYIDLSYNKFYGQLSEKWGESRGLTSFRISNNNISGGIPPKLAEATHLCVLDLSSNQLVGEIPIKLASLISLFHLSLSDNKLSGKIPLEISKLYELEHLNLAANDLSGPIPKQLGDCTKLLNLNLSKNNLGEGIPFELGNLHSLQSLDLSRNLLTGEIPQKLVALKSLEILNISHNELRGSIQSTLDGMLSLTSVDISYNQLEGPLPNIKAFQEIQFEALRGNKGLCGNTAGLKACSLNKTVGNKGNKAIVCVFHSRVRTKETELRGANNQNLFSVWSYDGKLVYNNIIDATNEFNSDHCIGEGGFGVVYKAHLPSRQVLAVKKFEVSQAGELAHLKSFESEIRALTEIRHLNIVKLYGFCSHPRHSFLVYEYLERGSLKKILSNEEEAVDFEWIKRVNVIKGVANGLSYMHHECSPPIIHRDISSKNVLLDGEYVAHISDFGTARFVKPDSYYWTSFAGTFGYAAPGTDFGVLTLEVIMGNHPGSLITSLPSYSSPSWSKPIADSILLKDVLDQRLPPPRNQLMVEVVFMVKLALSCLRISPKLRPTMKQVSADLSKEKPPLQNQFYKITVGELFDDINKSKLAYTMEVDKRLDVYSFGVLTLEVLMGSIRAISSLLFPHHRPLFMVYCWKIYWIHASHLLGLMWKKK